ncbi:hypothetical protein BHM03_00035636 [Ensete ventricosum]|nr:hypothetical protein BHM03_00035636 [Ensete ventricosum]
MEEVLPPHACLTPMEADLVAVSIMSCRTHHGPTTLGAFKNAGRSGAVMYVQMVGLFVVVDNLHLLLP